MCCSCDSFERTMAAKKGNRRNRRAAGRLRDGAKRGIEDMETFIPPPFEAQRGPGYRVHAFLWRYACFLWSVIIVECKVGDPLRRFVG